ncbi:alkaline phosphatase D [Exophiala aquamarina CBS 119918]|uniref:5'-3' exoribonuclease 1 n=1 Tax=Exophiala aquamarina CBS 119918 TaxID=1182545 RepID=A0A072P6C6_9EURO|nr:alkaline phosphatase D [Exophiala aquamarina CBS 119918]KEF54813.1 alkaline phosphatase D [Exophiala aquamarina CBS 119918]
MGVPKFFRWLSERYPAISQLIAENRIPEFDCLYLDMNGIIHNCTHKDSDSVNFRMTEDQMFIAIFNYIEHLFGKIKPKQLFFMAIDGVAPRAKMNQQRSRRFRTALEAEKARDKAIKEGLEMPKEEPFDSNCITPGTEFMAKLTRQLKYFISKKVSEDVDWQGVEVVLSGHEVPGEGEHKIMEYIRQAKAQPAYDPNVRHCLYGLDADLIMLGLLSHDPHFCLLREEVTFGRQSSKKSKELEHQNFYLMHLCIVREYLELEFQELRQGGALTFPYDLERIIDDFILMAFFVGNDFLPNLPNLHINEGALALMFQKYKQILPTLGGYINEHGVINLKRLEVLLDEFSEVEHRFFEADFADAKWINAKRDQATDVEPTKANRGPVRISSEQKKLFKEVKKYFISPANKDQATKIPFDLPSALPARDRKFVQQLATDLNLQWSTQEDSNGDRFIQLQFPDRIAGSNKDDDDESEDEESQLAITRILKRYENAKVEAGTDEVAQQDLKKKYDQKFLEWKDTYYKEKYAWGIDNEAELKTLTENYVQGLQWVLYYYYRGVASWPWYYASHYSPMISDVKRGLGANLDFQLGQPFRPFQQLMGVLPDRSKKIVPEVYHELMTSKDSPIIDFYPRDFELDMNGKKMDWEAVVKIPFIDEKRLLSAMAPKDKLLTADEKLRNDFGVSLKFTYSADTDYTYPSSLVGVFPDLSHCHCIQNEFELPTMDGLEPYVGLVEGVKLGAAALAGFPSLKFLPFTGSLGFHGVNVFQQDSRNESMVVTLSSTEARTRIEHAKLLLNQCVYVGYPFLQEAKIVKVSDELFDYTMSEDGARQVRAIEHSGNEIDQFHKKADRIDKWYSKRLGMLIGDVESLVQVEMLKGLKKLDNGSTVKEFAELPGSETTHAAQLVVEDIVSKDVRFIEQAALPIEEEFPDGTNAFFLGDYAYGRPLSVTGHEGGKAKCLIAMSKAPQKEFGREIALQAERLSPYTPSYQIARSLNLNSLALAKITSSFSVKVDETRVNLGLNLKFEAKKLKVLGYSRKSENGWEFSRAAIELIQQYMIKFPEFIAGIHSNPQGDMLPATSYIPGDETSAKARIKEIQAWLKEIESKSFERVPLEAEQLDSEIVKRIEHAADEALRTEPPSVNKTIGGVPRNGLLKPSDAQWRLGSQKFSLGDRIIYVADSGKVPIASKGTVVGLTQTSRESLLDVVFDVSFMSGTSLGDRCSPFRGSTVPTWSVLNLSNRQVLASSKASVNRNTNGTTSTPLTISGYGQPGIDGRGQYRPAQAPPALRGSWRGAVAGQPYGRGNQNGAGRGQTLPIRNGNNPFTNSHHSNGANGPGAPSRGGTRGMATHSTRGGYQSVDRGDPTTDVIQNNPNFRARSHNNVPPPASLNNPSTPRGRGRGRGGPSRGGRGTTSRGGAPAA